MTVFASLKLAHRETIDPAQLGRTLCTEVAEQVPYWVAVLTPAERPLLAQRSGHIERSGHFETTSTTVTLPDGPHRPHVLLLAALGSAVCTWQRSNRRGSSAGVLVDLDLDSKGKGAGGLHPVRLPTVCADVPLGLARGTYLLDEVARRLDSVPNGGRDYALARNYRALASRPGAQIIVRGDASAEPSHDHALDIAITEMDNGSVLATLTWASGVEGIADLVRFWTAALSDLAAPEAGTTGSSAA